MHVANRLRRTPNGERNRSGAALSGVFFGGEGVWTVPEEIDLLTGQPTMANANDPATLRQSMNEYVAANLGLCSRRDNSQMKPSFGGISAIRLDPDGQPCFVNRDNNPKLAPSYPFPSQLAARKRNGDNRWTPSSPAASPP
ncbi:MAG: hypothetical protein VKI63_00790 [Cyanobium sp.]|nr:hypothetical protein [Cyanobium sp.]